MTSLIVDANVAVAWYLPESRSSAALALLADGTQVIAPELILAEIGNATWKRCRRGEVSTEDAVHIVEQAAAVFAKLVPLHELASAAMRLSARLDHPIYDCFYLALAERERAPIVSADAKLLAAAKKLKTVEAWKL